MTERSLTKRIMLVPWWNTVRKMTAVKCGFKRHFRLRSLKMIMLVSHNRVKTAALNGV